MENQSDKFFFFRILSIFNTHIGRGEKVFMLDLNEPFDH